MTTDKNLYNIRVTFLGTATSIGVPVITCNCPVCKSTDMRDKRLRASIRIEVNESTFIIDCGPDFRIQMLRENVENIDAVIFTHEHRDHIAGIDDIRAYNYILNRKIDIYGTKRVMKAIETEFPYIFSGSSYIGAPQLEVHLIVEKPFTINDILITPINVMHEDMPIMGFRIGDFTYITDASFISDTEMDKIRGSKVVVLNALRKSRHISHFSLSEAVGLLTELKPGKGYLTHMSHFIGLHEEVNAGLPPEIQLAYDGLSFEV